MSDNGMNRIESGQTSAAAARPGGGLSRPLAALLLAVVMAVSIGAAAWMGRAALSPLERVALAAGRSAAAYGDNPAVRLMNRVTEGGSVELLWNLKDLTRSLLGIGLDLKASGKVYYDAAVKDDPRGALAVDVALAGSSLFDLLLTGGRDEVALSSRVLLGEEAYGVSLENFWDNFDGSVFGPDGAYSFGMSAAELREALGSPEDSVALEEAMVPAVVQTLAAFCVGVEEHARFSEEELELAFRDGGLKVDAVGLHLDGAGLAGMVEDMVVFLRDNEAVKDALYLWADAMPDGGSGEWAAAVDALYAQLNALTGEDFQTMADEVAAEVEEVSLLLFIHPGNGQLVGVETLVRSESTALMPLYMKLVAGPDMARPDTLELWMAAEGETVELHWQVEADDEHRFSARLAAAAGEQAVLEGSLDWDRETGSYAARLTGGSGDTYGIDGTLEADVDGAILTIDALRGETAYGDVEEQGPLGLSVILRGEDDMPALPAYTDVLTMSAEQLEGLLARLESALSGAGELLSAIGL